jgi:hypothetical protein
MDVTDEAVELGLRAGFPSALSLKPDIQEHYRQGVRSALEAAAPAMLAAERERIAAAAEEMADELEFDVFLQDIVDARNAVQDLLHRLAAIARGES